MWHDLHKIQWYLRQLILTCNVSLPSAIKSNKQRFPPPSSSRMPFTLLVLALCSLLPSHSQPSSFKQSHTHTFSPLNQRTLSEMILVYSIQTLEHYVEKHVKYEPVMLLVLLFLFFLSFFFSCFFFPSV